MKRKLLVLALVFAAIAAPQAAQAVAIIQPAPAQAKTIYDVWPVLLCVSAPWAADSDRWLAQTATSIWGERIGNAKEAVAQFVAAGMLSKVKRHAAYLPALYVPTDRVIITGDWFGMARVITSANGPFGGATLAILAGADPVPANDVAFVSVPQTIGGNIRIRRDAVVALQRLDANSCNVWWRS